MARAQKPHGALATPEPCVVVLVQLLGVALSTLVLGDSGKLFHMEELVYATVARLADFAAMDTLGDEANGSNEQVVVLVCADR